MNHQSRTIQYMKNNLKSLNPMELQELDEIITPRAAELLAKAFGPGIFELLAPLTEDDEALAATDPSDQHMDFYEQGPGEHPRERSGETFGATLKEKHTGPQAASVSEEALRKMMRDPRYWRERDPQMIEKVTKGFGRLHSGQ